MGPTRWSLYLYSHVSGLGSGYVTGAQYQPPVQLSG
jgi:hypothetical protein